MVRRRRGDDRGVVGAAPSTPWFHERVAVAAVAVVLAVGLVVLVVVAREVGEREAVVGGDEVDRGRGPAVAVAEQVARPGEPGGEVLQAVPSAARAAWARTSLIQKRAHGVAEAVVPLR